MKMIQSNRSISAKRALHKAKPVPERHEAVPERHEAVMYSVYSNCDGYGCTAQQFLTHLKSNVDVVMQPFERDVDADRLSSPEVRNLIRTSAVGNYSLHYGRPYASKKGSGEKQSIFTMWETNRPPSKWAEWINQYDQLIVPEPWGQSLFEEAGVTIPIVQCPLGVETELFQYKARSFSEPFTFLIFANGEWTHPRKNYQLVLDAFTKAFGDNPNVRLALKVSWNRSSPGNLPPNVRVLPFRYTRPSLVQMMARCHCLVFPSNGEGWGLPPWEALATGMPVIATDFSALTLLADKKMCVPIEPRGLVSVRSSLLNYLEPDNNGSGDFGLSANVHIDDVIDKMRWVYGNYEVELLRAKEASEVISRDYNWSTVTNQLLGLIQP
jgi:glycosyltransferase involved in cell wall biosynthesis